MGRGGSWALMLFVVGLGNPGTEHVATRHNIGFEVVERLADRHGYPRPRRFKNADVYRGTIKGHDALLIRPLTYMNLSGDAVGSIVRYYKGEERDVIVIHDELDFEPGEVRVKLGGGHGGHNGVRSVASHLGRDFVRVRVGIGKPPAGRGATHVLSRFDALDRRIVDDAVEDSADAVEMIIDKGVQKAMNRYNTSKKMAADDGDGPDDNNGNGDDVAKATRS